MNTRESVANDAVTEVVLRRPWVGGRARRADALLEATGGHVTNNTGPVT